MVAAALKEIAGVRSFFRARGEFNSANNPSLQKSFGNALIAMINGMKMGPSEATQLIEALQHNPYGDDQTRRICDRIDSTIKQSHLAAKAPRGDESISSRQQLKAWWNYFTESEWARLRDPKIGFSAKMTMMVERGMSIGCIDPDERSLGWCLATLFLVHYQDLPGAQASYAKLQELKQSYVAERKAFGYEQLSGFPNDPNELHPHIFSEGYPDSDNPPIKSVLQGVHTIFDSIPLRSNSKLWQRCQRGLRSDEAQHA